MGNPPKTRSSLLLRLRDRRDAEAWSRFVLIYAPIIEAFVRKRGLQDADARDLTQDVLAAVAAAIGDFEYSPTKGSYERWKKTPDYDAWQEEAQALMTKDGPPSNTTEERKKPAASPAAEPEPEIAK